MIFYLTYNDLPSGIFSSQVIDVVKYLRSEFKTDVKLVSFISLRNFLSNRRKIKEELSNAIVLPMYPMVSNWRKNSIVLKLICSFYKPNKIIGRSVFATQLALLAKKSGMCKTLVYDGRGAIASELEEYQVVNDKKLVREMLLLEKETVLRSDYRIAISNALIAHWQERFGYSGVSHVIIPCTLNKVFETIELNTEIITTSRKKLGLDEKDVVFIYSGSLAGWQSVELMMSFLNEQFSSSIHNKALFLTETDPIIDQLIKKFPHQVIQRKVSVTEVPQFLMAGDHALLIRERSLTNKVASPVKFAEYLACGLKVIISEELGDYSEFVKYNSVGSILDEQKDYQTISIEEKVRIRAIAMHTFVKSNYRSQYEKVISIN